MRLGGDETPPYAIQKRIYISALPPFSEGVVSFSYVGNLPAHVVNDVDNHLLSISTGLAPHL